MHMLGLAVLSGALVGLVLALIGGGGSILAVPLLIYVVGVSSPHVAIGTSSVAVTFSAALGLALHARRGTVKWRCAALFALVGIVGALAGSSLGKAMDGNRLLALFGMIMVVVGVLVLRRRESTENATVRLDMTSVAYLAPRLIVTGLCAGAVSGFFGIGGGFLIVPALMYATDMPLIAAIGSSLLAVTAFGAATASNYALSALVDWPLAAAFAFGGVLGGLAGTRIAAVLTTRRRILNTAFSVIVICIGAYIVVRGFPALLVALEV
jgi:uncharacterized membrane protein YfcA